MSIFTDRELAELRELTGSDLGSEVTVYAAPSRSYDASTGRDTFARGEPRYSGPASIRRGGSVRDVAVGEEDQPFRNIQVDLPYHAPLIFVDDQVEVEWCDEDPELEGEVLTVTGVRIDDLNTVRRLSCEHVAASSRTPQ